MADEVDAPEVEHEATGTESRTSSRMFDQADVDRMIKDRLARENIRELKRKASEYDQLQEAQKTEHQKMSERLAEFERKASEADLRALKIEVAASKGLSATQAKRLQGTTREELEADADEIIEAFGPKEESSPSSKRSSVVLRKTAVLPPGAEAASAPDLNAWMREHLRR